MQSKMKTDRLIREVIRKQINNLFENVQLADKVYYNTKKLSPKVKQIIIDKITGGDNYTKIISDIYYAYLVQSAIEGKSMSYFVDGGEEEKFDIEKDMPEDDIIHIDRWKEIKELYGELKNYNKNIFPITGLDMYNPSADVWSIINALKQRKTILKLFKNLPSAATRNMKNDIRTPRGGTEMNDYRHKLDYFMTHFSLLGNRSEELQKKVWQKMFKSNTTIEDLWQFVDDKESFLGGEEFTKQRVEQMIESGEDMSIVHKQGKIMIVDVYSPYAIKQLGCNSLWCFTYGSAAMDAVRDWQQYSTDDMVHVIIDFSQPTDSKDFMFVLIKPLTDEDGNFIDFSEDSGNEDNSPLFDMANENYYDPYLVLESLFGSDYKKVILKYLNFGW